MVAPEAYLEEIHEYEVSEDEVSDKMLGYKNLSRLACGLILCVKMSNVSSKRKLLPNIKSIRI